MGFGALFNSVGHNSESIVHGLTSRIQHDSQAVKDRMQEWQSALQAQGPNHSVDQVPDPSRGLGQAIGFRQYVPEVVKSVETEIASVPFKVSAYIPEHVTIPWLHGGQKPAVMAR